MNLISNCKEPFRNSGPFLILLIDTVLRVADFFIMHLKLIPLTWSFTRIFASMISFFLVLMPTKKRDEYLQSISEMRTLCLMRDPETLFQRNQLSFKQAEMEGNSCLLLELIHV